MSKLDDNLLSTDPKIDILLCDQNNWVLENMCITSLTGFNALKEFLQTIKNCFEPHSYLDHYLNLVKDVEYDLVFWNNQYELLNTENTIGSFQLNNSTNSSNDCINETILENTFNQKTSNNYFVDESTNNYCEISSDVDCFKFLTNNLQSDTDNTQLDSYREDRDEHEIIQSMKHKKVKIKKERTDETFVDSDIDTRIWYKCGWNGCSFGSFYNGVVKRHNEQVHKGEIKICVSSGTPTHRFKCDWPECNVSLVAYHKLVEHKRIHTGEKPFKCKWNGCNYATARLYSIISHYKSHRQLN